MSWFRDIARRRDGSTAARGKGIGCKLYPLCASSDHHESAVAIVAGKSDARVIPIKQAKTLTFENTYDDVPPFARFSDFERATN